MARPLKSGLDYFPHDTDASSDEKLEALQALYGNDGYAFYFKLLERIYHSENAELDISDAETIQILCRKHLLITLESFNEILVTALKWGCFDRQAYYQRKVLTSPGIKKRAGVIFEKRKEMQQRYEISRNKGVSAAEIGEETGVSAEFLLKKENNEKHEETQQPFESTSNKGVSAAEMGEETGVSAEFLFMRERKEKKRINITSSSDKDTILTTAEISQFTTAYANNIEEITPLIAQELADACRCYTFDELMFAVRAAAEANVRKWSYIAGVLERRRSGAHSRDSPAINKVDPDKYIKGKYGHMVHR